MHRGTVQRANQLSGGKRNHWLLGEHFAHTAWPRSTWRWTTRATAAQYASAVGHFLGVCCYAVCVRFGVWGGIAKPEIDGSSGCFWVFDTLETSSGSTCSKLWLEQNYFKKLQNKKQIFLRSLCIMTRNYRNKINVVCIRWHLKILQTLNNWEHTQNFVKPLSPVWSRYDMENR